MSHVCCGTCKADGRCCSAHSCCLECHFALEEELAKKYNVPPRLRRILAAEHRRLKLYGFPAGPLKAHARREMVMLRPYLPPHELARLDEDHAFYDRGDLAPR